MRTQGSRRRGREVLAVVTFLVGAAVTGGLVAFEPWRLFTSSTLNEAIVCLVQVRRFGRRVPRRPVGGPCSTGSVNETTRARPDLPVLTFASAAAFGAWLADHHQTSPGLWLKVARKGSGGESVSYAEAIDVALCYGWIDSQAKSLDDAYWLQRFTPRKPRSKWSKINCDKATRLIESGKMRPAGLREVERAKADGRWDAAYDSPRTATVPDDLQAALDRETVARDFFAGLDSRNRYAILHRIADAKKPETRARRIEKYVAMLARKEKLHS
jgi:uncharacterized protein YdeI (YjbR/CyaY-like superfamily)